MEKIFGGFREYVDLERCVDVEYWVRVLEGRFDSDSIVFRGFCFRIFLRFFEVRRCIFGRVTFVVSLRL